MSTERRIRKLRIRTDDRATLPRINFLFEDALRTASLPGIPANGQVFIKKLNLGSFLPSVNSRFLSKRIDDLMRHLTPVKVESAAADQPNANVVWFADALEPYHHLSELLAGGHCPQAWYWPVAIAGWSPHLTISQSIELIISRVAQKESGLTGVAYVLEPLLKREVLLEVIDTFEPKQVVDWLLNVGLKATLDDEPSVDTRSGATDTTTSGMDLRVYSVLPALWKNILHKALLLWRVNDPRTLFTAYLGIARARHKATPAKAAEMIRDAIKFIDLGQHLEGDLNQGELPDSKTDPVSPQKNLRPSSSPKVDDNDINQERPKQNPSGSIPEKNDNVDDSFDDRDIRTVQTLNKQSTWPKQGFLIGRFAGDLSQFAGLPFLITVLERLGYEKLLLEQPEYLSLQMAERIFWQVSALLKIPEVDPILGFLNEPSEIASTTVEFVAPMQWRSILKPSKVDVLKLSLAPVAGLPGQRLIMDQKARLVLGLWHSNNKAQVQPWLDSATLLRTLDRPRTWDISKAVDNFVRAIGRYLRCNTRMNLRTLIQRQAYVAITRTHLDITTHLHHLDIRVRSAGLDIDSGWVPWLGRVVQFHYIENEG